MPRRAELRRGASRADGPTAKDDAAGDVAHRADESAEEDRLRLLTRTMLQSPASIVITDAAGLIEYVNPCFERVSGYTAAEVVGKNPRLLKSGLTPAETYREMWATITRGGEWQGEIQNRRKDGRLFWEMASISGVRDAGGRVTHYVAVKEDITTRRENAERLRRAEIQLLDAQKMEAVGRLAGGIAHDFNNLLSAILGHSERLREELGAGHPQLARVEHLVSAANRAAELTRQLLAFSQRQVLEPRVVRLDAVAAEARPMLARILGEGVEIAVSAPERLGAVLADPGQVMQVLLNIAINARDAMRGEGRLSVELADVEIGAAEAARHPSVAPGPFVRMAVSDSGHGMEAETQRRIFEPFFSTKPGRPGTGLGLGTVYGIVRQSGGFVEVDSEVGRGTTFNIHLPRVDAAPEPPSAPRPPARPRPVGARILLVEDDDAVRGLMADLLESEGYTVQAAGHPEEALALAGSAPKIDLLLTDVIMPGMSGRDLAGRLLEARPDLRVLYVSGYTGHALAGAAGMTRGDRLLQKPFTEADLLASVAEVLAGSAGDDGPA